MNLSTHSSDHFYSDLPGFTEFSGVADDHNFQDAPPDWLIVISDIKGSTREIENGRYKQVNILGASTIIAILNSLPDVQIPFVFGGDGASFVIPPSSRTRVEKALDGAIRLAAGKFQMELRAGIVPVKTVLENGYRMKIGKMRVSPWAAVAMFSGGGMAFAEKLIKSPDTAGAYEVASRADPDPEEDRKLFQGLECRWEPVHSRKGETLCLIVQAMGDQVYSKVIEKIHTIFGSQKDYNPVSPDQMKVTLDSKRLLSEERVRTFRQSLFVRLIYPLYLKISCVLGRIIFRFGLQVGEMNGRKYLDRITSNSDFQKFDDTLRMTLDSHPDQRKQLIDYLETQKKRGELSYGLQISDSALMTCMVFDRDEKHFHFIDGSSGGYALAAKQLKASVAND